MYVEDIRIRLSDLLDIPYPSALHLYRNCIYGYNQLSAIVGYFAIDSEQVGINSSAQAKVWLNNNFES